MQYELSTNSRNWESLIHTDLSVIINIVFKSIKARETNSKINLSRHLYYLPPSDPLI